MPVGPSPPPHLMCGSLNNSPQQSTTVRNSPQQSIIVHDSPHRYYLKIYKHKIGKPVRRFERKTRETCIQENTKDFLME